jgi:ATP synthase I chain
MLTGKYDSEHNSQVLEHQIRRLLDNLSSALLESAASKMSDEGDLQSPPGEPQSAKDDPALMLTAPDAVERRVLRNIFAVVALAVVAAAIFADLKFMMGLILGGALALLNYKWLNASLRAVLVVGSEKTPPGTLIKFVVRWLVIATVAWAANKTGYFDPVAILAGLLAPAAAVAIEAAYVGYKTLAINKGERR